MASDAAASSKGAEKPSFEDDAALLEGFCSIPAIDKAWCIKSGASGKVDVVVSMSQRNLPANSLRKYLSTCRVDNINAKPAASWVPFPWELSGASSVVPSPSGKRVLIVRNGEKGKDGGAPSPTKLEIWGQGRLVKEVFVPATTHGGVYADGWFEGISWSSDEKQVAYVAEEPAPSPPVYGRKRSPGKLPSENGKEGINSTAKGNDAGTWKGRTPWAEDWGEKYTDKGRPLVYVLDIASGEVAPVEGIPGSISAGQVVWAPGGEGLVFTGWSSFAYNFQTPKKLGMIYCFNRPCNLYAVPAPWFSGADDAKASSASSAVKITSSITSAFSPRFSPDGSTLAFLSLESAVSSGVHNGTCSLHVANWPAAGLEACKDLTLRTLVDVIGRAESAGAFPGLYCLSLPRNPWLADGTTLVLHSAWRSDNAVITVNVESGHVSRVSPAEPNAGSFVLLDVSPDLVIAASSSPTRPAGLVCARPSQQGARAPWAWKDISVEKTPYEEEVEASLREMEFKILQVPVPSVSREDPLPPGAEEPFEAILIQRKEAAAGADTLTTRRRDPLLLVPHGGPHSVTPTAFFASYAFLAASGFAVLHVNFRGSTGFGDEALQSLPTQAGRQDVADCLAALDVGLAQGGFDPSRVAVVGGSHGGFLAGHLIGQAPDRFQTAILRNPVCNISSMIGISDIPDWCYVEAFGKAGLPAYSEAPGPAVLEAFHKMSPIAHVDKVKVPTLFMLGAQDRRVPVSNGLQFVHALRARGLEAKVMMYPEDTHAIDRPQSEFDHWVTAVEWLREHLSGEKKEQGGDEVSMSSLLLCK